MADGTQLKVKAWRQLMHVHARVVTAIDERLRAELGISGAWYEALVEIALAGGTMQMSQFAEETTLTKSGATRFVDRLVSSGLVERMQCPTDRRIWQLTLTPKGKELQKRADPVVLGVMEEEFGRHMDDGQARSLLDALTQVRDQAGSSKRAASSITVA